MSVRAAAGVATRRGGTAGGTPRNNEGLGFLRRDRTLPTRVGSFLEDFQSLDVRRAKALLQTILKAAHVYRDDRIELSFRT